MAERKAGGAGLHLGGVLERATQPKPVAPPAEAELEVDAGPADVAAEADSEQEQGQGAGQTRGGQGKAARQRGIAAKQAKKVKGRTIYLPDDLFERLLIQSHRREMTISDYVAWVLGRNVPDHRGGRAGGGGEGDAA